MVGTRDDCVVTHAALGLYEAALMLLPTLHSLPELPIPEILLISRGHAFQSVLKHTYTFISSPLSTLLDAEVSLLKERIQLWQDPDRWDSGVQSVLGSAQRQTNSQHDAPS